MTAMRVRNVLRKRSLLQYKGDNTIQGKQNKNYVLFVKDHQHCVRPRGQVDGALDSGSEDLGFDSQS